MFIEITGDTYGVGDIHGDTAVLQLLIKCHELNNCTLILLGDIGIWRYRDYKHYMAIDALAAERNITIYAFRGNHDNPAFFNIDDKIPFCEYFVIPYVFWYLLIVVSLGYFLLYNVDSFKRLQIFIIITQAAAMVLYILFPSRQDLRPVEFPRDNFLTDCVAFLYSVDTNTGVCPSLHVAYSIGIASVWLKEKAAVWYWKTFVVVAVILICLSTMFIKQHSAVDFFAALPVCLLAELIVYRDRYFTRKKNKVQ